jgi:hypothetical protein
MDWFYLLAYFMIGYAIMKFSLTFTNKKAREFFTPATSGEAGWIVIGWPVTIFLIPFWLFGLHLNKLIMKKEKDNG